MTVTVLGVKGPYVIRRVTAWFMSGHMSVDHISNENTSKSKLVEKM